jgi:peroxiredoxin
MRNLLAGCAVLGLVSLPALADLKPGAVAPPFTAQAAMNGKEFQYSLRDSLKKGPVVVYFYPSAYTYGCNIQAHSFSVNADKFAAAGASIVGVSLDSIRRLDDFSRDPDFCAGKFPTASDPHGQIAKQFNVVVSQASVGDVDTRGEPIEHAYADRTTFVVTPDGKIAATIGGLAPVANVEEALGVVQKLAANKQ